MKITYIVASHKKEMLDSFLYRNKCLKNAYRILVLKDYKNVAKAYNNALKTIKDDEILIFLHHDVFLPKDWDKRLEEIINRLPNNWGCLGLAGTNLVNKKQKFVGNIRINGTKWIHNIKDFVEIETIDELMLIVKAETMKGIKFDNKCARHFYGADLCFKLKEKGYKNYIINNYAHHNGDTNIAAFNGSYSKDFYKTGKYMTKKYNFSWCTTCCLNNK